MGVPLSLSCVQIANEENIKEKNEIFVETLTSTATGYGSSALIGAFLVSNPVGWGTVIVLAVGTAAASYGMGKAGRSVYSAFMGEIDFVDHLGVNTICK